MTWSAWHPGSRTCKPWRPSGGGFDLLAPRATCPPDAMGCPPRQGGAIGMEGPGRCWDTNAYDQQWPMLGHPELCRRPS
eukprot:1842660-Pyramimonas_sp.AAC.1